MNWKTKKGALAVACTQCCWSKDKCIQPDVSLTHNTAATPPPPLKEKPANAKPQAKPKSKKAKTLAACKCITIASQYSTNSDLTAVDMVVDDDDDDVDDIANTGDATVPAAACKCISIASEP